jgi:hypothetical protein
MQRLSPLVNEGPKGALVGTIADEAFIVFQLNFVCLNVNGRKTRAPCGVSEVCERDSFAKAAYLATGSYQINGFLAII